MINIGFEVLDKKTKKNASEEFFETMEKLYKDKGEEASSPCGIWYVEEKLYEINGNEVRVGNGPIYGIHASKPTSVIIDGDNNTEIFKIISYLQKETKFKLKKVENGN